MASDVASARDIVVFVKKEVSAGTLVYPVAGDAIPVAGYPECNQQPSFSDSPEIINSRDIIAQFADQLPAGSWKLALIARPSGTAGTAPVGDVLIECLMGKKTVTGGTSVAYGQQMSKPSFSLWYRQGHTIFFVRGATVSQGMMKASAKGPAMLDLSGGFMRMGWAGTDALDGDHDALDTTIVVEDARKYSIGARIHNVTKSDHATTGYEVTDINVGTNTLTISPGIVAVGGWDTGDVIAGYLPTPSVPTSYPVENRDVVATIGGVTTKFKSLDVTINDPVKYLEDEITATGGPESYVEDTRSIEVGLGVYFRKDDLVRFYDGLEGTNPAVSLAFGAAAGKIMTVAMPKTQLQVPALQVSAPTVDLQIKGKALGSSGEDSCTITFT